MNGTYDMESLFDIAGKGIVITGGSGVLGGEMARQFAARGAQVAVLGIQHAEKFCETNRPEEGLLVPLQANVLDKGQLEGALELAEKELGQIDVLVNAAGGNKKEATCSPPTRFFDLPPDALRWVFELNCLGTMLPCQVFGDYFSRREEGIIINVSSMSAVRPLTNVVGYSAAKSAITNFTAWLSTYMAQRHSTQIRVNAIAPGFFLTKQNRFLLTDEKTGELTERGKAIIAHTPAGRFGEPEDLIGTMVWLMSEASKFVTGTVIPIDGGYAAFGGV